MKYISLLMLIFLVGCASRPIEATSSQDNPFDAYSNYSIKTTLDTARQLQDLGEQRAIATLTSWAKSNPDDLRTIVMCRMLFKGKQAPLRRPYLGGAVFFGETTYADWPLEPIAIFEGVSILITRGYELGGEAESAEAYLSYCIQDGSWISENYEDKTSNQIKTSLKKFMVETKWKQELSGTDKQFLMSQGE
jgi:hypothetical protein